MTSVEIQCYNKSCGAKYNAEENTEKSCQYHPGVPVFHDALKGWSCCKKRTTDFTDFLKIPGCTFGYHSNEKPSEVLKPKVQTKKEVVDFPPPQPVFPTPQPIQKEDYERPSADEILQKLQVKLSSSYSKEKLSNINEPTDDGTVKIGTKCRNSGCECAGCTKGAHVWKKSVESTVPCRYDHHQTGKNVIISIFAKLCNADTSSFEANQVYLKVAINFEGNKHFDLNLNLSGVIDPESSLVTVSGTKVEISLRKSRAGTWKSLGEVDDKRDENEKLKEEINEIKKDIEKEEEESEGSDLDGIDDVIFD